MQNVQNCVKSLSLGLICYVAKGHQNTSPGSPQKVCRRSPPLGDQRTLHSPELYPLPPWLDLSVVLPLVRPVSSPPWGQVRLLSTFGPSNLFADLWQIHFSVADLRSHIWESTQKVCFSYVYTLHEYKKFLLGHGWEMNLELSNQFNGCILRMTIGFYSQKMWTLSHSQ